MFGHEADQLQHFIHFPVNVLLIGHTADDQAFGDDLPNCHTGIDGGDRILEDHLHPGHHIVLGSNLPLCFIPLGPFLCGRTAQGLHIPVIGFLQFLQALFPVELDTLALFYRAFQCVLFSRIQFVLQLRLQSLDFLAVAFHLGVVDLACVVLAQLCFQHRQAFLGSGNLQAVKIDVTLGGIIQVDDRPSGRGLSASALTYQAENLALLDEEADVIHRLGDCRAALEILFQVLHAQQHVRILFNTCGLPERKQPLVHDPADQPAQDQQQDTDGKDRGIFRGNSPEGSDHRNLPAAVRFLDHIILKI